MEKKHLKKQASKHTKTIIKKCHSCGSLNESEKELDRCQKCRKAFLPSLYFYKVHAKNSKDFQDLFSHANELSQEDLIKGLIVLW